MNQRVHIIFAIVVCALVSLSNSTVANDDESAEQTENDKDLEVVTVIASRTERNPDEVPATVSVIENQQLDRELSSDIADLIRYEPNVSVGGTGSRWGLQGFTIRGIGGNRVLVVVDGVRVPDEFSFGPFLSARRDVVDVDSLSKIEILRGPISVLHGSDALGGVVAYTTKPVRERVFDGKNWFSESKYRFDGSNNNSSAGFALGFQNDSLAGGLFLNSERGSETQTAGSLDVLGPQREQPNPSDISSDNIVVKLSMQVSPLHFLSFVIENFNHEVDTQILSDYGSSFFGTTIHSRDGVDTRDRQSIAVSYEGQFDSTFADVMTLNLYNQSSDTEQLTAERRQSFGTRLNRTRRSVFEQNINGILVQIDKKLNTHNQTHHLIVGWDAQSIDSEEIRWGATAMLDGTPVREYFPYPTRDFPLSKTSHRAVFLQDEITLLDGKLLVSAGIRHHWYEVVGKADEVYQRGNPGQPAPTNIEDSKTTTKFGSMFNINSEISVYASLAQGFRAPPYNSVNVGFTNPIGGYKTISNSELQSETSNGFEIGLRYLSPRVNGRFVAFWNKYEDFIEDLAIAPKFSRTFGIDPSDGFLTFQSINRTEVDISGWELSGEVNLLHLDRIDTRARMAYGTTQGEASDGGLPLNSVDPAKLVVGIDITGINWNGSIVITHVQDKQLEDIAEDTFPPLDGHTVVDIMGEYQIRRHVKLNAGVFNMFSEEYIRWADVATIGSDAPLRFSQPGRHAAVSVSIQL